MPRDLIIVNCKQLVTLAGPLVPRVGPALKQLGIIEDGASVVLRYPPRSNPLEPRSHEWLIRQVITKQQRK